MANNVLCSQKVEIYVKRYEHFAKLLKNIEEAVNITLNIIQNVLQSYIGNIC